MVWEQGGRMECFTLHPFSDSSQHSCQEGQPISKGMSSLVSAWGELSLLWVCKGLF